MGQIEVRKSGPGTLGSGPVSSHPGRSGGRGASVSAETFGVSVDPEEANFERCLSVIVGCTRSLSPTNLFPRGQEFTCRHVGNVSYSRLSPDYSLGLCDKVTFLPSPSHLRGDPYNPGVKGGDLLPLLWP